MSKDRNKDLEYPEYGDDESGDYDYRKDEPSPNNSGEEPSDQGSRRYAVHFIVIAGIIALIAGGAFSIFRGIGSNAKSETVVVSDVSGMRFNDAAFRLKADGLEISCLKEIFSSKPSGVILDQDPQKGAEVKKGRTVLVTVSKGPESAEMPDVRGMTSRGASNALNAAGIKNIKTVLAAYQGAPGIVIAQEPVGGSSVSLDSSVTLTVSRAQDDDKGKNIVPDVSGKKMGDAAADLISADLSVEKSFDPSSSLPQGTIISQSIKAGTPVVPGMSIRIVISGNDPSASSVPQQEPPDIPDGGDAPMLPSSPESSQETEKDDLRFVPLLAGKHIAEAKQLAENADLRIGEIKFEEKDDLSSVIVSSQCPEAGIWVKSGTPIDVVLMPYSQKVKPAENAPSHNDD